MERDGLGQIDRPMPSGYLGQLGYGALGFFESIWVGAKLVLTNRCFVCACLLALLLDVADPFLLGLFPT